jgi:putative oxidoreductase
MNKTAALQKQGANLPLTMQPLFVRLRQLYQRFFGVIDYLRSPFLLAVRLYWGWQLIESGWGKLHNLEKVTEFFTSLNLPMPAQMAVLISCLELFGGIFLAIGLLSRLTALALTVNMIMAYVTADREALQSIFSDPDKFYAAAPYTFLIASLIILIFGPGKICLDALLEHWFASPAVPAVKESRSSV